MDLLADVIAVMRAGRAVSARAVWQPPFGQRFAGAPGAAGFQVVVRGECWLIPDSGKPVRLAAGDGVLLPHGRGHVLTDSPGSPVSTQACAPDAPPMPPVADDGTGTVVVCGAYELAPGRGHPLLSTLPDLALIRAGQPRLRAVVELLDAELAEPGLGADAAVPALLDLLLVQLLRGWLTDPGGAGGWAAALRDPVVAAALEVVHREPGRAWTVAGLAARGGLSRAPFARRFRELVGQPPLAYLTWWRMSVAARLLRETPASVAAVAGEVGYASEFAFGAAFKRAHGVGPGRYRRERGGDGRSG